MNTVRVLYKEPGKPAEFRTIENTLKAFQHLVGGYIEVMPLHLEGDAVMLVNEEGYNLGLVPQCWHHTAFYGPAVIVGTKGEEFTDIPRSAVWDAYNARWGYNLIKDYAASKKEEATKK